METNLNKTVNGEASAPYEEDVAMNCKMLLEEAKGYRALGLLDEAEVALRKVMTGGDPKARVYAQCRLCLLLLGAGRFSEVATLGADLIRRGVVEHSAVINTNLALHHMGRIAEARETLRLVERCGHSLDEEAYQMACFASRLGEFPDALRWLCLELCRSKEYRAHAIGDTDLIPFWSWLRYRKPSLGEAHLLIETPFKAACEAALDRDAPIELSADDLANLTERSRRLFRYDFAAGYYVLKPAAVANDPAAAEALIRLRKQGLEMVRDCILEAHERAVDVVLDAQPSYAAEHAAWGNHQGARMHIFWALRFQPALLSSFFNKPSLDMMKPLLMEIMRATSADEEFLRRMDAVDECRESEPERAMELLDEAPVSVRATGLFRMALAGVLTAQGKDEQALPIWIELCRQWPLDAAGFSNSVACLMKLGRNEDAHRVLKEAPGCYRRYAAYWEQLAAIEGGEPRHRSGPARVFRGNPHLGGLLIPLGPESLPRPITEESLAVYIRTLPARKITLGIVYVEDIYETVFGDGYFSYPHRAFFSMEAAQVCADWVTKHGTVKSACGLRAIAKPVEIVLGEKDELRVPSPQGVELFNWEQMHLISMLNGDYSSWKDTVDYCVGSAGRVPDFESLEALKEL